MQSLDRLRLGKMTNPVRGFLHGTAALASVAGATMLTVLAGGGAWNRVAVLVVGVTEGAAVIRDELRREEGLGVSAETVRQKPVLLGAIRALEVEIGRINQEVRDYQRRVEVKVRVTSRRVTAQGNVVAVPKGPQSKHRWWTTCYKAAEQRKQVQDTQIGGSNLELHGNAAGQSQARISAPEPRHETAIAPMADCLPSSCRARSRCGDGASLMGGSWRHQSGWACLSAQLLISPAQLSSSRHVTLVT